MAVIGKSILENITIGMYKDCEIIYREYIQNACDQIDIGTREGLLSEGEGNIEIEVNAKKRWIEIRDNATGIARDQFQRQLSDIANSDKRRGQEKGFRGIGRLCGAAYCKSLVFTTSYYGESVESQMILDAEKMREILASPEKATIDDVLNQIVRFKESSAERETHYFKVRLEGINEENSELLDVDAIKAYLSFAAPVPFPNVFRFRKDIYHHAESLKQKIDEYAIYVQGSQIFKSYSTRLYKNNKDGHSKQPYDELFGVEFHDVFDEDNNLVAWLWYGLCKFEGAIPKKDNPMYGFRLRQHNIMIGDNTVLANLFKEDRGNSYFVGEVYAIDRDLIPNGRRDYFTANETRAFFEQKLREYFFGTLHKIYNDASVYRKTYRKLDDYTTAVSQLQEKTDRGFTDEAEKLMLESRVAEAAKQKDEAKTKLDRMRQQALDTEAPEVKVRDAIQADFDKAKTGKKVAAAEKQQRSLQKTSSGQKKLFSDSLSKLDKNKRTLVAQILGIVSRHTTEDVLEQIKADIEKEFK